MDKIVVHGDRPLSGAVKISGAKNAVLPVMAATLLAPGKYLIKNVPVSYTHLRAHETLR